MKQILIKENKNNARGKLKRIL